MTVQDDARERELVRLFNLQWDASHQRGGVDALLELPLVSKKIQFEVEVKSTTGETISTARDVGMPHIEKWRRKFFIIGFYTKEKGRPELKRCLCLTPDDMEPWIVSIERKILTDFKLAALSSKRLELDDLFEVCGEQEIYTVADAKKLHKQQWTATQYDAAQDITVNGKRRISQQKMLDILKLRSQYIAERGATLNNPHITKTHLAKFIGTDREIKDNWAANIRAIGVEFYRLNQKHPSVLDFGKTKKK